MAFAGERGEWSTQTAWQRANKMDQKPYCQRQCLGCGAPLMRRPIGNGSRETWEIGYFGCKCSNPQAKAPDDARMCDGLFCGCSACVLGLANGIVDP